jgi:magnesium transporter
MSIEHDINSTTASTTSSDPILSHVMVRLILPSVRDLIAANRLGEIRLALKDWHPPDLAELLEDLKEANEQAAFFRAWPRDEALELFEELEDEAKASLLEVLTHREQLWLLNAMAPDERADLFAEVEVEDRRRFLELLSPKALDEIHTLLSYPPESAGGLMTTAYVAVHESLTAEDVTNLVRHHAKRAETIYIVYVLDSASQLVGVVSLRALILAEPKTPVSELMDASVISVLDTEDQEEVAHRLRTYDLTAIPVVDNANQMLGIVTVDDVFDVMEDENTEDTLRMAAIAEYETPYLDTPAWILARQRAPWLMILVVAGFLSGFVLQRYESLLDQLVVLMFFIPVLTGSGGNAGIQVSTTVIRSMATHDLGPGDVLAVLRKEIAVAAMIGCAMGGVAMLRAAFVHRDVSTVALDWALMQTVGLAMAGVVGAAVVIGGLLPLGLKRIGLDPALMSSPFITTVTDSLALVIYFEVARHLLVG